MTLCQQMHLPAELYAHFLPKLYHEQRWKFLPQHLQLDALHLALYCRNIAEPARSALIESLNNLVQRLDAFAVGMAFEALERLGALEEEEREPA